MPRMKKGRHKKRTTGLLQRIEDIARSGEGGWLIDREQTLKAINKTIAEIKKRIKQYEKCQQLAMKQRDGKEYQRCQEHIDELRDVLSALDSKRRKA